MYILWNRQKKTILQFSNKKVDTGLVSSLQKEVVIRTIDEYYSTCNNEQKWSKMKITPYNKSFAIQSL